MNYKELHDQVEALEDKHQIKLLHDLCEWMLYEKSGIHKSSITTPEDMVARLGWMKFEEVENFVEISLDASNQVIAINKITQGLVNKTPVHPRESFKKAISDNAVSVIFAHNHPSGSTEESQEDIAITKTLCEAGRILQIPVLDHMIISMRGFNSLCRKFPEIFEKTFSS